MRRILRYATSEACSSGPFLLLASSRNVMKPIKAQNLILLACTNYSLNFKIYAITRQVSLTPSDARISRTQKKIIPSFSFLPSSSSSSLLFFFFFLTACSVLRTCVPQHGVGKNVRASPTQPLVSRVDRICSEIRFRVPNHLSGY